jgi:hypothetical protein
MNARTANIPQRSAADVQADIAELEARYNAACNALKFTPWRDPQHDEWKRTVQLYPGRRVDLIRELKAAQP